MTQTILIIISVLILVLLGIIFLKISRKGTGISADNADDIRPQFDRLKTEKSAADERILMLDKQLLDKEEKIRADNDTILELNKKLSKQEEAFTNLQEKIASKEKEIIQTEEKLREAFRNLANQILEEKTTKFTEQNQKNLDLILKPLGDKIKEFEKKVEDTYDKEAQQRSSLKQEIKILAELNQQISKEASNLTTALKGQAKTRGNWGEIILESILEKSGLVKDREYFVQQSFTNEQGKRLQPDVVVTYPGERSVIIDSKVSLNAYELYSSSENKDVQDAALKDHLDSIRSHVNSLNSKNYQDIYQIKSVDFVMMFMPIEPAYMLAMQYDPNLWNYAYEKRVLLISPTNLIAALRMIANLWRVEYQNKNAMEIARQGGELYDKFKGFVDDLDDVGKKLTSTKSSYDDAMNKLASGKGNLIRRAEKIRELGAKTSKELPKNLLDKAEED